MVGSEVMEKDIPTKKASITILVQDKVDFKE